MTEQPDPRQPAFDAVFAYIRRQPVDFLPATVVDRNAMIWHAVDAALNATPDGRCVSSGSAEGDRIPLDNLTSDALDALYDRIATLEHVAAGNKRHVQLIVPDLEKAEAAIERVREIADRWDNALAPDKPYARAILAALDQPQQPTTGLPPEQPCTDPRHTGPIREQLGCVDPAPAEPQP